MSEMIEQFEKRRFLFYVIETIKIHPDWLRDLLWAIQEGISNALIQEREEKADLAYSLVTMVQCAPKITERHKSKMQKGLRVLKRFFTGAGVEKEIATFITEDNEEEE